MNKLFKSSLLALAFVAATSALAYTPAGTLTDNDCTTTGNQIHIPGTCTVGVAGCGITWTNNSDSSFRLNYLYLEEQSDGWNPLEPSGANALPFTSCTENGGYNCLRMKVHGTGGSTTGCGQGCTYSFAETSVGNETNYYHGPRYEAGAGTDFGYSASGYFNWTFDQTAVGYVVAEVNYTCNLGGHTGYFHRDFLIHVVN